MDFTTPEFQIEVEKYFEGEKLDLILSDASIKKSGNKFSDQAMQIKWIPVGILAQVTFAGCRYETRHAIVRR